MSILRPDAPTPAAVAFNNDLPKFLAGPLFPDAGGLVSSVNLNAKTVPPTLAELTAANPGASLDHDQQEVFVLGLQAINAGKDLSAATPAGWRFFAGYDAGKVVVGYAAARPPSNEYRLTAVSFGAGPTLWLQQAHSLDSLPQPQTDPFQLRYLRVPGLNIEAYWLVSGGGGPDLIIPSPAGQRQLQADLANEPVYDADTFLSILRSLAQDRLTYPAPYGS